jgi:hypothetical protein
MSAAMTDQPPTPTPGTLSTPAPEPGDREPVELEPVEIDSDPDQAEVALQPVSEVALQPVPEVALQPVSEVALQPASEVTIVASGEDEGEDDSAVATFGEETIPPALSPAPEVDEAGYLRRLVRFCFGTVGLLSALSVLAAIPILQFMTLGWMLEAEGRMGRGGRLRDALPGMDRMQRIGSAIVGCLVVSLPFLLVNSYFRDAQLLARGSSATKGLAQVQAILIVVSGVHAALAVARGGAFSYFFRPFSNLRFLMEQASKGRPVRRAWAHLRESFSGLRLGHYLGLGVMGFVAAFAWLALPTAMIVNGRKAPGLMALGAVVLALIAPYVVVAQARLATQQRFRAAFELRAIRAVISRAPLATALAVIVTLGLAVPLYFWKIEPLPRDARWLPALFFVAGMLPGRLLAGWAFHRGDREGYAHWGLRWPVKTLLLVPAGAGYVFVLFFAQLFAWHGAPGLFAHHAFLLPVAFY